jgi:uncharacterized protein YjaG (DUF416 family)
MNKIERAIQDTTTELKRLRNMKICFDSKIEALEEQLESLESIERDKLIPHVEILSLEVKEIPCVNLEPNGTSGRTIVGNSNIGATKFTNIDAMNMYTHISKHTDTQNTI